MVGVAILYSEVRLCLISNKDHFLALVTRMGRDNSPDADVRFDHAPIFNFDDGKVKFDTNWFDNANGNYGSASAFVPKSLQYSAKRYLKGYLFAILLDYLIVSNHQAFYRFHL